MGLGDQGGSRNRRHKFEASMASASRAIDRLAIPGLREALNLTGAGNNPAIVKAFARLGQMVSEEGSCPAGAPPAASKSPAETIYDGNPKGSHSNNRSSVMATLSSSALTLSEWATRLDPGGKPAAVIELLGQTNEMLTDMLWMQCNDGAGHKTTSAPACRRRLAPAELRRQKSKSRRRRCATPPACSRLIRISTRRWPTSTATPPSSGSARTWPSSRR